MSRPPVNPRPGRAMTRRLGGLSLLAGALLLGGCAGAIRLENDVRSYADWSAGPAGEAARPVPGDRYRFERRPSQLQAPAAQQEALEAIARDALARWTVELGARSVRLPYAPWDEPARPSFGVSVGIGHVFPHGSVGFGMPLFPHLTTPYYQREVSLVLRDARSARVVYETQASHDGPWADNPTLWAALLDAALQGFPQAPAGPRRVVIEVPR
ncbi:hypothetical protein [Malikia spinosa]|uniref:DUF4136 domain-containing protein n=1 Tax=Malikia spinosa TaxID=86180 RepID=A0A7C9J2M2_9BURK|nr:hypothetical protein [Malikia spinosa]MYZ51835.1 hypothetical protein [Malikia spinosa]